MHTVLLKRIRSGKRFSVHLEILGSLLWNWILLAIEKTCELQLMCVLCIFRFRSQIVIITSNV